MSDTDTSSDDDARPGEDARFADSARPARVVARDADDLAVVSALVQDAAFVAGDVAWLKPERRFAMLISRFRWEEPAVQERVRAGLHFEGVLAVRSKGFDPSVKARPGAILGVVFQRADADADNPAGRVAIALAGGGEIALDVEALEVGLKDLGRPWSAKSRPSHGPDDGPDAT